MVARLDTDLIIAQAVADAVAERFALGDVAVSLSDAGGGRWQVAIHFRGEAKRERVRGAVAAAVGAEAAAALQFGSVQAADWVRQSLAGLRPVAAGRFVVHGAHDRTRVPLNHIGIEIEAALAFGTGHHGTTRGCLLALDAICKAMPLAKTRPRILDVGTGSGVLAIAAARALHDGVGARTIRTHALDHLIFANILLGPLKRIATPLRRLAAPGGRVVLSGILPSQANAVIAAYRPLALQRRLDIDGWTTLVLVRTRRC